MPVDLSEFEAAAPKRPKGQCWFGRLSADEQRKVNEAHTAGYSQRTIEQVVSGWGHKVTKSPIGNHFMGRCNCGK